MRGPQIASAAPASSTCIGGGAQEAIMTDMRCTKS
jgi:hypothetical protein